MLTGAEYIGSQWVECKLCGVVIEKYTYRHRETGKPLCRQCRDKWEQALIVARSAVEMRLRDALREE